MVWLILAGLTHASVVSRWLTGCCLVQDGLIHTPGSWLSVRVTSRMASLTPQWLAVDHSRYWTTYVSAFITVAWTPSHAQSSKKIKKHHWRPLKPSLRTDNVIYATLMPKQVAGPAQIPPLVRSSYKVTMQRRRIQEGQIIYHNNYMTKAGFLTSIFTHLLLCLISKPWQFMQRAWLIFSFLKNIYFYLLGYTRSYLQHMGSLVAECGIQSSALGA